MPPPPFVPLSLCSELVTVLSHAPGAPPRRSTANLEEIGHASVRLLLDEPVPVGTPLCVRCQGQSLRGTAVNCRLEEGLGHRVELRLGRAGRDALGRLRPAHLLCLADLSRNPDGHRSGRLSPRANG